MEDVKGLIEQAKSESLGARNMKQLAEMFDNSLEAVIKEKKPSKKRPTLHKKMDSMIEVFDRTRKSYDNNTQIMVAAFGQSMVMTKNVMSEFKEAMNYEIKTNKLDYQDPSTIHESVRQLPPPDEEGIIDATFRQLDEQETTNSTLDDISSHTDELQKVANKTYDDNAAAEDKQVGGEGPREKEPKEKKKGLLDGLIGGIGSFMALDFKTLGNLAKGFGKKLGKLALRGAVVIGVVSGVYNGLKTFADDAEVKNISGKEAIDDFDRSNAALSSAIEPITGGLISSKDAFGYVEETLGHVHDAIGSIFDPESGVLGKVSQAFFDYIEDPSIGKSLDFGDAVASAISDLMTWIWESAIPDPIKKAIKGITGDVTSMLGLDGIFGGDEPATKDGKKKKGFFTDLFGEEKIVQPNKIVRSKASIDADRFRAKAVKSKPSTKSSEVTKAGFDDEIKLKRQLAAAKQQPNIINNNNVNNVAAAPRLDVVTPGAILAGAGR